MEYSNKEMELAKNDKEIEDICSLVKTGLHIAYLSNPNLTQPQKQELIKRAKSVCDFAEFIAKLTNRM